MKCTPKFCLNPGVRFEIVDGFTLFCFKPYYFLMSNLMCFFSAPNRSFIIFL